MSLFTNIKSLWVIIIVLVVLNVFLISTIWISKQHRPINRSAASSRTDRGTRSPMDQHFIPRRLNFTESQISAFNSQEEEHRNRHVEIVNEIKSLREQLVASIKNDDFDSVSEDLVSQIGQKQAELELNNFRNFKEVMSLCDSSQKQEFLGIMGRVFSPDHRANYRRGETPDRNSRQRQH